MIIKEYRCIGHGVEFESSEEIPTCPYGCSGGQVVQEFRTPPGIMSGQTRTVDRFADQIAGDYGLTDMHNDGGRGPDPSKGLYGPAGDRRSWQPHQLPRWTGKPFQFQAGWAQRGEAPPVFNPQVPSMPDLKMVSSPMKPVLNSPQGKDYLRSHTILHKPKRESPN